MRRIRRHRRTSDRGRRGRTLSDATDPFEAPAVADKYTSRTALVLDAPLEDVGEVVTAAGSAGDIDRGSPARGSDGAAYEVHWGGRMQKAVVRAVADEEAEGDGAPLLRTETYLGGDGLVEGMKRQAQLLQGLSRQLRGHVQGVRDLSAVTVRDEAWMNRLAIGAVSTDDAIVTAASGEGTWWVRTHGAARFDVPDLELYGLSKAQVPAAEELLPEVQDQLLRHGLKHQPTLPDGTTVFLVPVLEAWTLVPLDWPGVGRAGQDRGRGLDGPRATLSVLHRPRLGRYKKDLAGVLAHLAT
jgi:hypothetical protein